MDTPIFIVGLPRSGSTLWSHVIAKNPSVFEIGEMLMLTPPWRRDFRYFLRVVMGGLPDDQHIRRMVDLMFSGSKTPGITGSFWQYTANDYDHPELKQIICTKIQTSDRTIGSVFRAFIEELSAYQGYDRCSVKFPVFVNHVPDLLEWYPDCKIVHATRDPRAMAVSRANFRGQRRLKNHQLTVLFAILQYVWTSQLHRRFSTLPNYKLVHYEDLLVEPKRSVRELCDFAEIDFVARMLEPVEGQASSVTGTASGGFNRKAGTHWMGVISPLERRLVTTLTRPSMRRFGYDPEHHPIYLENQAELRPA